MIEKLIILLLLPMVSKSSFSINYYSNSPSSPIVNNFLTVQDAPSPLQVADIYNRISGHPPLLKEEVLNLPTRKLWENTETPIILEVQGGALPSNIIPVLGASDVSVNRGLIVTDVVEILNKNGVYPETFTITNGADNEVNDFLEKTKQSVVILYHSKRLLNEVAYVRTLVTSTTNVTNSTNSSYVPLTEFQISQYQICLWTGIIMFLLLFASICTIVNMEVIPDSLLFSKFQSIRTNKRVIEIMVLFKISLYPLIFSISWALINYQLGQVQKSLVRSNLNKLFINSPAAFGENGEDIVWIKLRKDAEIEAQREPLLASFMHATILSHSSLEKSLSFHMANQLSSPAMISTQIQALFLEAFDKSESFRSSVRSDILAVMDRDPAVKTSPDVLLYFKGFQALQTHRVSHWLWKSGRATLALFLQSRANTVFQIDIHPGAQLGDGVFIDHGTGVVIGETAVVGNNVSMLHKVTLGGSGKQNVQRHPIIGDGVLLGAGATLLGNIKIGEGAHIGACSMVLEDIPAYSVAVGVPVRIVSRRQPIKSISDAPAFTMETNKLDIDNKIVFQYEI